MDKTININLGGTLFQIDEEAFRLLRDYLQAINNRFANVQGGNETIEDIELRIAEIFQTQKGLAGVVTKDNVEAMISIIGKPEDFDHGEPETAAPVYTSQKRRLYRNPADMVVSGVCGGIGAYLDTDPVLFRILFVISAMFGIGVFVYIILWIALPVARTDSQKREMFGDEYHKAGSQAGKTGDFQRLETPFHNTGYNSSSKLSNAINEIFRAIGRVFYIIFRIFLIMIGVVFVLTGFLFILCFIMIFVFNYPGVFSVDSSGVSLIYLFDFLNYFVSPKAIPWIILLSSIALILPMLAMIYWGVKMIFWFKARDGVVTLAGLVIWVMTVAALAIIGFNEGINFSQTAKTSAETVMPHSPDTLYIRSDKKISDLKFEKELSLPHKEYSVFIDDEKKELFIRPILSVDRSDSKITSIEVKKESAGSTEMEAMKKSEDLQYNYHIIGDTLHLDEYFTSPARRKWAADNVIVSLHIPSGTVMKFVDDPRILLRSSYRDESDGYLHSWWESGVGEWIMTRNGLEPVDEYPHKHK